MTTTVSGRLSDAHRKQFEAKLWQLMKVQVRRYTGGDSSSVPVELAEELLESVLFTLGIDPKGELNLDKLNLEMAYEDLLKMGQKRLEKKLTCAKWLWHELCLQLSPLENISLHDTLKGFDGFWKQYNASFFAHQIPCDIDYQLANPVPNTRKGVDYVIEYLTRLTLENTFLKAFETKRCKQVLETYYLDYKGLLVNLYEPVLYTALACNLLGKDVRRLSVKEVDLTVILKRFEGLTPIEISNLLKEQVLQLHHPLHLLDENLVKYAQTAAESLVPRIKEADTILHLKGVFFSTPCDQSLQP